jgi:hypothetical protein
MRTVCTHVAQSAFAATMSAMRLWLDQNGNPDVRFETATDRIGILISVEFSADDVAHAFERRFGNTSPATHVIAA